MLHKLRHTIIGFVATLASVGCLAEKNRPNLGEYCTVEGGCGGGSLCVQNTCVDPDGDEDGDGLTNAQEVRIGTYPNFADSDRDGIPDREEVGDVNDPHNRDGDDFIDALDSAIDDEDSDCIPDQLDPDNGIKQNNINDVSGFVEYVCSSKGVCAGATLRSVSCSGEPAVASCIYTGIEFIAVEDETTPCDGLDNDCDGQTDEEQPDNDGDLQADCQDEDDDNDGTPDKADNCPMVANPGMADTDGDGLGDACDPPAAPRLTAIAPEGESPWPTPRVSGIADPFHPVDLYINDPACTGPVVATATGNDAGVFNAAVPVFASATSSFSAVARNAAGLRSACVEADFVYTHILAPPDRPVPPTGQSAEPTEIYTANGVVTVRLCIAREAVGHVHLFGAEALAACAEPPAANIWELVVDQQAAAGACGEGLVPVSATIPLVAAGEFVVRATTTTAQGGTSSCDEVAKIVYLPNLPTVPMLVAVSPPSPSSEANLAVRASAERLTNVRLHFADDCSDAAATEAWVPATVPSSGVAMPLAIPRDATTTVYARAIDRIGQSSPCAVLFTHTHLSTTTARAAPPSPHPAALFTPASPSNVVVSPELRVCVAESGVAVSLYRGTACALSLGFAAGDALGVLGVSTQDATCTEGFSVVGTLPLSADTTTPLSADFVGASGLRSYCGALGSYSHDGTAPPPLMDLSWAPASPSAEPYPTLSATAEPLTAAVFYGSSNCNGPTLGSAVASAAGELNATIHIPAGGLNRIWTRQRDSLGNTGSCYEVISYELQTTSVPAPLRVMPLEPDVVTNADSVTIQVCAATDHTTVVFVDYSLIGLVCDPTSSPGLMTPVAGGSCPAGTGLMEFELGLSNGGLATNGTTRVSVHTAPNALESGSPCRVLADIQHDNVAPSPPQVVAPLPPTPSSNRNPVLFGSGEPATTLKLSANATCSITASPSTTDVSALGTWQANLNLTPDGTINLYGRLVDRAGNASACVALRSMTHDGTPPPGPVAPNPPLSPASDASPSLTLCSEVGASLGVYADLRCAGPALATGAFVANSGPCGGLGSGMWTNDVAVTADAATTLFARATDVAGNASWCEPLFTYTHDGTPPAAPEVETQRAVSWDTTQVDFIARGWAEIGGSVAIRRLGAGEQVPADGPCVGTGGELGLGVVDRDGAFAIPYTVPLTEPVRVAVATIDAAGNESACAGPFVMVDAATLRLEGLERYQTVEGLEAGTVSFHRPDGALYSTHVFATSADSATALVFDGCYGAAFWKSNGFPEDDSFDPNGFRVPEIETMRGVDTVHLTPEDDVTIRLRAMPGPPAAAIESPPAPIWGNWNVHFGEQLFDAGTMVQLVWDGCPNAEAGWPQSDASVVTNMFCAPGKCVGSFQQIAGSCLDSICIDGSQGDVPCSRFQRHGEGRLVALAPLPSGALAPTYFSDKISFDVIVDRDNRPENGIPEPDFGLWQPCVGDCAAGSYWRAELPVDLVTPQLPVAEAFSYLQRCRFVRNPWRDDVRSVQGYVSIDTTCWTERVCVEGTEPMCTKYRYDDELLVFPVPQGVNPGDPLFTPELDRFAVVPVSWFDGQTVPLSATVVAWEQGLDNIRWARRFRGMAATIDGQPVLDAYNVVRLTMKCEGGSFLIYEGQNSFLDVLDPDDARCFDSRECVEESGGVCTRYLMTGTVVALGYDVDMSTGTSGISKEDLVEPLVYTEPVQVQWFDDAWAIDAALGPWLTDWRALSVDVTNDYGHTMAASVGAGNIFGSTPLALDGRAFDLENFNPDLILGPSGADGTFQRQIAPGLDPAWAVHLVALDVAMGAAQRVGFSLMMQGARTLPAEGSTISFDASANLATIFHAQVSVGLDAFVDPDYRHHWDVSPTSVGGAPLDAVILFGHFQTRRTDGSVRDNTTNSPNSPLHYSWFRTHVMPPWAADGEVSEPELPLGLEAWHVPVLGGEIDGQEVRVEFPARAYVTATTGFSGGDFGAFKRDFIGQVPSLTAIVDLRQEEGGPGMLDFIRVLSQPGTFRFGMSLGGVQEK